MPSEFDTTLATLRPALVRHCYRMLGSFADAEDLVQDTLGRAWTARSSFRGDAPVQRWLFTIATNACLNALAQRRRRSLPQLEADPSPHGIELDTDDPSSFITPAPDSRLFPDPAAALESRESVALAFIALLQRVPPRQRAALLLKDVLGWPAEEIATALEMTLPSVNSALHRAREATAHFEPRVDEPAPESLPRFVFAWESHDLDALVALLREDIELAMPPYPMWFRGLEAVTAFFRSPRFQRFWSAGLRLVPIRANGAPAFAFYRAGEDNQLALHSIMVSRFHADRVAAMDVFLGPSYGAGFGLPPKIDRTIPGASLVMTGNKGEPS